MKKLFIRMIAVMLSIISVFTFFVTCPVVSAATVENSGVLVFSKKLHGEMYISKHFKIKEYACKDGSDMILIDPQLVLILQQIRDYFGKPITINSAYRTASYNKKIGGTTNSRHVKGMAADISVKGISPAEVAKFAETLGVKGIGLYETSSDGYFVHIDTRSNKSYWYGQAQQPRSTFGGNFHSKTYAKEALINLNAPESIKVGQEYAFTGTLLTAWEIKSCAGKIIDISGNIPVSFTFLPKGKYCELSQDADGLHAGIYTLEITASAKNGKQYTYKTKFVVLGSQTSPNLSVKSNIVSFKKGKLPTIEGTIQATLFGKIKRTHVLVINNDGGIVQEVSSTPNARKVKVADLLRKIDFQKLKTGKYSLVIIGCDSKGKVVCRTQTFTVK